MGRILLGLWSRYKTGDALDENLAQIAIHIECEALKHSEPFEDFCFNDQYLFFLCHEATPSFK